METVVITGANRGIGLALTRRFLRAGKRVVATCRNPDTLQVSEDRANLDVAKLDVADGEAVSTFVSELSGEVVDVLLNNAGVIGGDVHSVDDVDYDAWREAFEVNMLAPFRLAVTLRANLQRSARPRVVTVSSVNVGDPPALPGRHPGFDSSGRAMGKLPRVSRSSITQGSPHDELSQSKPHEMGVPVPRRFHPEVPEESHLRGVARVPRGSIAPVGAAAGERGGRRASAGRPRPHVVVNSAETLGGAGDRIYQREERDSHCPGVRGSAAQFRRAALLGPRLLCVHSGSR